MPAQFRARRKYCLMQHTVRKAIADMGGTMPENLTAREDIKHVKSDLKKTDKAFAKEDKKKNANATNTLSDSIKSVVTQSQNNVLTLEIQMEDYGPILDAGRGRTRRPGTSGGAFFASLKEWVGIKLKLSGKAQLQATNAIFKKINKRGYKPKPFIQSSINTVLKQNERKLSDAAFRVLVNQIDAQFKNIQKKL